MLEQARKKLLICRQCPEYLPFSMRCKQCGCVMPFKVVTNLDCPLGKWDLIATDKV